MNAYDCGGLKPGRISSNGLHRHHRMDLITSNADTRLALRQYRTTICWLVALSSSRATLPGVPVMTLPTMNFSVTHDTGAHS